MSRVFSHVLKMKGDGLLMTEKNNFDQITASLLDKSISLKYIAVSQTNKTLYI